MATGRPDDTAAPPPAELPAGRQIDQFRIIRPLGRGGMGVVYEAEDTLLGRKVAIKTLARAHAAGLLREAQAAARLDHPNVVRVLHVGRWEGGYYLVMELVAGGSLQARIRPDRPMRWETATRAVAQACRGLAAAHAAGFVHRDIKPGNLMLDPSGRVKVADFGLVRGGDLTATAAGSVTGTPHYMSPEQCRGEPADVRSDVYALGGTYYALLTGRPPYPLPTSVQVMFAHCTQPPPDPQAVRPDLPAGCGRIVRKAMAKEPADRYPSADALLADLWALSAAADAAPLSPPLPLPAESSLPDDPPEDTATPLPAVRRATRRTAGRRTSLLALLAVAVVLAVGCVGVVWAVVQWMNPPNSSAAVTTLDRSTPVPPTPKIGSPFAAPIPVGGATVRVGGQLTAVAFSPDGKWLAAGGTDGGVVWSTDGAEEHPLDWKGIGGLAWSVMTRTPRPPEEAFFLLAGTPIGPKTWDAEIKTTGDFGMHWYETPVGAIGAKRGWRRAVVGVGAALEGIIRTWNEGRVSTGDYPEDGPLPGRRVRQVEFAPGADPTMAAVVELTDGGGKTAHRIELFDTRNPNDTVSQLQPPAPPSLTPPPVTSDEHPLLVAFHPRTGGLVYGTGDRVWKWDRHDATPAAKVWLTLDGKVIHALAFSPDGLRAATADAEGAVTVWNVGQAKSLKALGGGGKPARGVAFSPDGRRLAAGDLAGDVRVWDLDKELR